MNAKDFKSIERKIIKFDNLYKNSVLIRKMNSHGRELLRKNEKYRDKFKGKRCFILGNGPSINTLDFENLKNEITFTVNEMFRHEKFELLNSNFHFFADPAYFKLQQDNKEDKEIIDLINNIGKSPIVFLPIESEKIIKKYGWDRRLRIQYFASNLVFYNDYDEQIDFTKYIPVFQAVVQWCIAFAIYAGFKEIYLLGCDATNIITDLTLFADKQTNLSYAYYLSEEAADAVKRKHLKNGLEYTLYGYHRIVHLFGELSKYCKRNEILLCNASGTTIIDSMPRKRFCDILEEKTNLEKDNKIHSQAVTFNTKMEGKNYIGSNSAVLNSNLGYGTYIANRTNLKNVKIGKFTAIGSNVCNIIGQHPTSQFVSIHPAFYSIDNIIEYSLVSRNKFQEMRYSEEEYSVSIGNDVWIGNNVKIMEGVTIADGSIIGAGAVVIHDTEPYSINAGVPAKMIRYRFKREVIEKLCDLKWWDRDISWIEKNAELFEDVEKLLQHMQENNEN